MLVLDQVRKTYRLGPVAVEVLKGVSLDVRAGDLLSIMGPSGCGKSTLLHILGLLDRPSAGTYALRGQDVSTLDDDALAGIRNAQVGFVFQSFHLLPRLTALQNVGLPLVYRGVREGEVARRAVTALERVGMAAHARHRPRELSGGQQQRVALARALIGDPGIILADEPTGALDPHTGSEVMDLLDELSANGIAVVIVTHDGGVAERCRRRTRMEGGRLHEIPPGKPD